MAQQTFSAWTFTGPKDPVKHLPADFGGPLGAEYVQVKVTHCGVCHTDLSMLENEWGITKYPIVCGHEVVGVISAIGSNVTKWKIGDRVGCSNLRDTCHQCDNCLSGNDNLCSKSQWTLSQGGFGEFVRLHETFVFKLPDSILSEHAAPLMCAGSTVYPPFKINNVKPGARVGVVGIGGLGHLALQFARAWGTEVTAVSTSKDKEAEARKFGAHHFLATGDMDAALKTHRGYFDFLIVTVPHQLDWSFYCALMRTNGTISLAGLSGKVCNIPTFDLVIRQLHVVGAAGCSRFNYQEMIDFCALHNIRPQTEIMPYNKINEAIERVRKNAARYRIVLSADAK